MAKKAYEIAYALWRIAARTTQKNFADLLSGEGIALLGAITKGEYGNAIKSISALEYYVRFGVDINLISMTNGEILSRELSGLQMMMPIAESTPDVDLSEIFSRPKQEVSQVDNVPEETGKEYAPNNVSGLIKAGIRQTAIIEKIRQSGNCRLKDIQEILPELSERTIRYDLQSLVEQNLVERVGTGGPAVFYRIRQPAIR